MDKDGIRNLFKQANLYFPTIALVYLISKNNNIVTFIMLVLASLVLFLYDKIINDIKSKINLSTSSKRSEQILSLESEIKSKKLFSWKKILLIGILQLIIILANIYAIWNLFYYLDDFMAIYLLIFGAIPSIFHYIRELIESVTI